MILLLEDILLPKCAKLFESSGNIFISNALIGTIGITLSLSGINIGFNLLKLYGFGFGLGFGLGGLIVELLVDVVLEVELEFNDNESFV